MKSQERVGASPLSGMIGRSPITSPASGGVGNQEQVRRLQEGGKLDAQKSILRARMAPLPFRAELEDFYGVDLGEVKVHTGMAAEVGALGAKAVAIGDHVAFADENPDRKEVAEEVAHVLQQGGRRGAQIEARTSSPGDEAEKTAQKAAFSFTSSKGRAPYVGKAAPRIHRSPLAVSKVMGRVGPWLEQRAFSYISEHIRKHLFEDPTKPIHSVFLSRTNIRSLAMVATQEATALAAKGAAGGARGLKGAGVQLIREDCGPKGIRWVVEREFAEAIGTKGERILRMVVSEGGTVISAFPIQRFQRLFLSAAAVTAFDQHSAAASEGMRGAAEAQARAEAEASTDWGTFVVNLVMPVGLESSGLNEGEELQLALHRTMNQEFEAMIGELEQQEGRPLTEYERSELRTLFEGSIATALYLNTEDQDND